MLLRLTAIALSLFSLTSGCAKSDTSSPQASPARPLATDAATAGAAAYTDIAGVNGETEIVELATLGIFDPKAAAFEPGKPILRREFIRWLVRANNALWADTPAKQVRTADATEASAFSDLVAADPDFPYVQGMQDAGYSVGFPDKTFKPDIALTREQMFAIKNVFDRGSVDAGLTKSVEYARNTALPPWKDKAQISKTYVAAIATGLPAGVDSEFDRVYGASSLFHPQLAVTRAQAAVLLAVVGDHSFYGGQTRSAARLLASPSATP